ncbi:GAF domain-containing protein [Sphingomonas sp. Leaf28]|uniref:GAF domain-containing protein n=1 Tax=Sphingomonas sp. Leaf28 TaxID=1735695 RepID=UPI0006F37594|nr:GAF domain-containing protein [Sphingomonas sp. Leaf28]KQN11890.1 histidine kinase [Sphingomonas sp. Leaf28]
MLDEIAATTALHSENVGIRGILEEVAAVTGMGFVAVARVTDTRWIACQVLDQIEFGMSPGDELRVSTTICNDIRESGNAVVIDNVSSDPKWHSHPAPALCGFKSYISLPIILDDGSFYGTLCAIDPEPRKLVGPDTVPTLMRYAARVAAILSRETVSG